VHLPVRGRALVVSLLTVGLCAIALPARAASPPSVVAAQQKLGAAEQQARQAATALGAAQQQLAGAQQQLAAVQAHLAQLDSQVATDTSRVTQLHLEVTIDKTALAAYLRSVYKSGGAEAAIVYILASASLGDAIDRVAEMDRVNQAGDILLGRIAAAQAGARQALTDATSARAQAQVAQEQSATAEAVVVVEEEQLQSADAVAAAQVTTARTQFNSAVQQAAAQAAAARAAAAAAAARANSGVVYHPVSGPAFTIDTDLTKPSGETADKLNAFLAGSALAGLGGAFMQAEQTDHVSARYFVAHAILESAWGTSAIAQDKHNLFGYGANDANPYVDAMTFSSFAACIQYVAQVVAQNYLSPSGPFYHGPTLRGMNVDYATDPNWATKIATIASTIPA
jgi:beta-N-acetylglucosaminidase